MHDWKRIVRLRVEAMNLRGADEASLVDELAGMAEDHYKELRNAGETDEEAFRAAVAGIEDIRPRLPREEPVRRDFWGALASDLRYAFRTMRKSPLFVAVVVFTLALGIGANTTVFTLVNTLILNPLPVREPGTLVSLMNDHSRPLSFSDLRDYQANNSVFSSLAGYTSPRVLTWRTDTGTEGAFGELVTGNYFSTLGLTPAAGRFFLPEEDTTPGAHPVAVLSYGTWKTRFGGAPSAIGQTLRMNNILFTVIGVAPPKFIGVNAIFGPDVWIPSSMTEQLLPNEMRAVFSDRGKSLFQAVGRLRDGFKIAQAQANATAVAADLAREYPAADEGRAAQVRPIRDAVFSSAGGGSTPFVLASAVLLGVVGIVLLIACSNVANLMLARASSRQQEMAVRLALGASRARLVRQLLTESVLLALGSGLLGIGLGYAGLRLVFGALPNAANFIQPNMDITVFLFALAVSLATGFLFGIVPAFKGSGASVAEALKEEARTAGRSRRKVTAANALLVTQVAFSFLLLVTAALFLRSIGRAYQLDPGFQTDRLALFMTSPGQAGYSKPEAQAFFKEVRARVSRDPAIESVSWSSNLPLWARTVNGLVVEGRSQRSQADKLATILTTVDLNYFETAGVTIDRGRPFKSVDQETSIPVAIVNEKLAKDYWPNGDALGKRIQVPGESQKREIVGIARTANYTSWAEPPQPCVYVPFEQNYSDAMTLYVRTKGDPRVILASVQREIREAGPRILANAVRTGREIVDGGLFQAKVGVALLAAFGLLALGLASIGLYGIMAYSVNQRKREIGLRMAMGAPRIRVVRLILRQGMGMVLLGVAIGFGAALGTGRLLSRMLYGVSSSDPISVAAAAAMLSLVALAACYLPARRASRVDPLEALRES